MVYADPPWRYANQAPRPGDRIEAHYQTMAIGDIEAMPIGDKCADDAVLFMWATNPLLPEALGVIDAWGFTYKTNAVWVKDKVGLGYWVRGKHELLLISTRGSPPSPHPSLRRASVIDAPRLRHSAKPECVAKWIEALFPQLGEEDRIELFCRTPRHGWTVWGNEV